MDYVSATLPFVLNRGQTLSIGSNQLRTEQHDVTNVEELGKRNTGMQESKDQKEKRRYTLIPPSSAVVASPRGHSRFHGRRWGLSINRPDQTEKLHPPLLGIETRFDPRAFIYLLGSSRSWDLIKRGTSARKLIIPRGNVTNIEVDLE